MNSLFAYLGRKSIKLTVARFELWIKETTRGTFITQETARLVDVIEAASMEEAQAQAQRFGGYAVPALRD